MIENVTRSLERGFCYWSLELSLEMGCHIDFPGKESPQMTIRECAALWATVFGANGSEME